MKTVAVQVRRGDPALDLETDRERVRILARLMDTQFEIGGIKVGWDAIIGLIPVVGDVVCGLISIYPLHIARKHGLSRWVQLRMGGNIAFDWVIGLVPVIGDAFDVAFKANQRNLRILE